VSIQIQFCGAAGTVTGSCFWISTPTQQFLIDCGMFQGSKSVKELNYGDFPFHPENIDFVLLTHAHIDHSGLLPKLTKHGFKGVIHTTSGTRDLLSYMLPDSAHIQETEVERLNARNRRRGKVVVEPIYTADDVESCLEKIETVPYEGWLELGGVRARFWNAGHILGSASIEVEIDTDDADGNSLRLLFSGDIGPEHKAFHPDPTAPSGIDYLICEATYGGRKRDNLDTAQRRSLLANEINACLGGGGSLVIPSFAVERTQELLDDLAHLIHGKDIPNAPVFIDSPLAIRVTSVFAQHADKLEDVSSHSDPFDHPSFHFTETVEESKSIARFSHGAIILAASGMCDAGRIRHHLKNHLWRPQSTILLVGYQVEGTLGRLLQRGVKKVKIQGEDIAVKASIRTLDTYSGHADEDELIDWVSDRLPIRQAALLIHGGTEALAAMRDRLVATGLDTNAVIIPKLDDRFEVASDGLHLVSRSTARRLDPKVIDKPDWHNDFAQLSLDIRDALDAVATDKQRAVILRRLKRVLKDE